MSKLSVSLLVSIVVVMTILFVATMFVPYAPARVEAEQYFPANVIDTGLQYSFERRMFYWAGVAIELSLLCALALTRLGRRIADYFLAWTGQRRLLAVLLFGFVYFAIEQLVFLPLGYLRLEHARAWEMSNASTLDWLRDRGIGILIDMIAKGIVGAGLYTLLIVLPRTWWLLAPLGGGLLGTAYVFLAPIVIDPLFNDFTPLAETKWRDQEPRLKALIAKAGVAVDEILVKDASRQSNHTNAYFTGFGATRRIVLYDTLLKNHTPEQVESVLGHELGHWIHDHIVKGLLLGTLGAVIGCLVLDRLLRGAVGRAPWNLQSTADPAGLPLVMLIVFMGTWVTAPLQNVVSRTMERQADREALVLAGRPKVFVDTEKKMAQDNLANVAPTPWNVWLFSTHPTTIERIRMAEQWTP